MIVEYNGYKPDISKALYIAPNAVITGNVILEEGVSVWYGAVLRGDTGCIHVGQNSNIQDNCVIHCEEGSDVHIGENVLIGHGAIIHGCSIENGCMIGMGAIVMNDAVIREQSLVGAGAMVTEGKAFPERSLILGSPAKAIKPVSASQIQMIQDGINEYLKLGKIYSSNTNESLNDKLIHRSSKH